MSPIKAIKAAYFSPSGGTKRAAVLLCEQFGLPAEYIDCTCPPAKLPAVIPVAKDELLVLALPVYGGFGPRVEGLFGQLRGQGGPCVILAAYGNRDYDDALCGGLFQRPYIVRGDILLRVKESPVKIKCDKLYAHYILNLVSLPILSTIQRLLARAFCGRKRVFFSCRRSMSWIYRYSGSAMSVQEETSF